MKAFIMILYALLVLSACQSNGNHPTYSIRDFRPDLQPFFRYIVASGFAAGSCKACTNKEAEMLSQSEHAILRTVGLLTLLERPGYNHLQLLHKHLNDTAIVTAEYGEFGISYIWVADFLIENWQWKSHEELVRTADLLLKKHPNLLHAYTGLLHLPLKEEYYPIIRKMCLPAKPSNDINWLVTVPPHYQEYALQALAKFGRPEDTSFIKKVMLDNAYDLGKGSLDLISVFRSPAYIDVLDAFYQDIAHRGRRRDPSDNKDIHDILNTTVSYKDKASADLMQRWLNQYYSCKVGFMKEELMKAIWANDCAAYKDLRKQIAPFMKDVDVSLYNKHYKTELDVGSCKHQTTEPNSLMWLR